MRHTSITFSLLVVFALLASCAPARTATPDPSAALSQQYKLNHDYASLTALLPYLRRPMLRSEVEALLGKPYCKNAAECLYPTEKVFIYCPAGYGLSQGMCVNDNDQFKAFELKWELTVYYVVQDYAKQDPNDSLSEVAFAPVE